MNAIKPNLLRQISELPLDSHTKQKLTSKTTEYIKKKRHNKLENITNLVTSINENKFSSIAPLLKEVHNNVFYSGHEHIRHFLKFQIPSWIQEDYKNRMLAGKVLDGKYKNEKAIAKLKFPRPVRDIPSAGSILEKCELKFGKDQLDEQKSNVEITPSDALELPPKSHVEQYELYDEMVRHVFRVINFISSDEIMHSKKIRAPMVYIPRNVLGDVVPVVRQKNLIKKQLTYLRGILMEHPPLKNDDCESLLQYVDNDANFHCDSDRWKGKDIRKEYRKFLRTSYTIDENGICHYTKHASVQPKALNPRLKEEVKL